MRNQEKVKTLQKGEHELLEAYVWLTQTLGLGKDQSGGGK